MCISWTIKCVILLMRGATMKLKYKYCCMCVCMYVCMYYVCMYYTVVVRFEQHGL